jgi:hypothetical protein
MKERRTVARQKSFLQGRIYFNNRRSSVDCLIRDISEQGARLKFSGAVATPDVVELYIPHKDETYRAKILWRIGEQVGVSFGANEESPPLAPGATPADLSGRVHKLEHDLAALQRKFNELQDALRQREGD